MAQPKKAPGQAVEALPQAQGTIPALPPHLASRMAQDAGKGTSQRPEDNIVPMLLVLQGLSPQVDRRNAAYVDGAEPGAILLRNSPVPIINGEEGVPFIPCVFDKAWIEWRPRASGGGGGSGFVGRHNTCPPDAVLTEQAGGRAAKLIRPSGTEIMETRYHVGIVLLPGGREMAYVIPFTSTGHQVSKSWQFLMNSQILPNGSVAPSFSCVYRLKTRQRSNNAGQTWFVLDPQLMGWVEDEGLYMRARGLNSAMEEGSKVILDEEAGSAASHDPGQGHSGNDRARAF